MRKTAILLFMLMGLVAANVNAQNANGITPPPVRKPKPKPTQPKEDTDCFRKAREKGVTAYIKGNYKEALDYFEEAKKCPIQQEFTDIDDWVAKCREELAPKLVESRAVPEPNIVKLSIYDYQVTHVTGCVGGRMGVRITVTYTIKGLKGKHIRPKCKVPGGVSPVYKNTEFDIDGFAGALEEPFTVTEDEMRTSTRFFIPFAAMRLANYNKQDIQFNMTFFDYMTNRTVGTYSYSGMGIVPASLYVNNSTADQTVTIGYEGGNRDFDISTCGNVKWSDLPSWIKAEEATIRIEKNTTHSERSATLRITPSDGGNTVRVRVTQDAAPNSVSADAVIKSVWQESYGGEVTLPMFHMNLEVNNHKGKEFRVYALFFNTDGEKLIDKDGDWIHFYSYSTPTYDHSNYEDFKFRIRSNRFTKAKNARKREAWVVLGVTFDGGQTWAAASDVQTVTW